MREAFLSRSFLRVEEKEEYCLVATEEHVPTFLAHERFESKEPVLEFLNLPQVFSVQAGLKYAAELHGASPRGSGRFG
jgi:hypothetical protein